MKQRRIDRKKKSTGYIPAGTSKPKETLVSFLNIDLKNGPIEAQWEAMVADNTRLRAVLEHLVATFRSEVLAAARAASEFNSLLETRKEALAIAREALEKKP